MIDVKKEKFVVGDYVQAEYNEAFFEGVVNLAAPRGIKVLIKPNPRSQKSVAVTRAFVKGVPITPKWLKDLGFKSHSVDQWEHQDFPFIVEDNGGFYSLIICDVDDESGFAWLVNFDYVHELQNLIYTLTKQELTVGGSKL